MNYGDFDGLDGDLLGFVLLKKATVDDAVRALAQSLIDEDILIDLFGGPIFSHFLI